jgi:outer membrane protein TolC
MLQVATFPSGADTVVVVWVRLWGARRERIPLVNADPDLAEKEALRNSSIVQQNELDVQARYGIGVAKSNGRFNATVATSVGFNQTASAFGDSYDSPLGRQQLSVGINLPMVQWGRARLFRAHLTRV